MREHRAWEPTEALWQRIRGRVAVAARASQSETLRGSRDEGYRSAAVAGARDARTISFSRDWTVEFAEDAVRIAITDSLSGGTGLEGLADSVVYEIGERVGPDELRGTYRERAKRGTFRMVRSRKREIVK